MIGELTNGEEQFYEKILFFNKVSISKKKKEGGELIVFLNDQQMTA